MKTDRPLVPVVLLLVALLAGCSSGPASKPQDYPEPLYSAQRIVPDDARDVTTVYDPWEEMNRAIYNFNYHFDQKVFLPVVRGWQYVLPDFAEQGIHNFFNNWRDLRTFWNSVLQLSPEKSAQSLGRVLINTTVGLLGFIDVATSMDIPRPQEDFGQTLGRWGVGQGPFLVVPFLGPSNLRDGVGLLPDYLIQNQIQEEVYSDDLQLVVPLLDAVDTRANTPFRYYENGLSFEYETVRWLWSTKRKLDVAK
jgi:phospholipid-binding lipoprotein MlaA